jgi:pimeloyl-CoA dehydrogenase small subunit
MDFDLNDDQRLLKESLGKLLNARYGDFAKRAHYLRQPDGFDRAVWAEYAEAGFLALPLPESYGGLGGGPVETMIVMEEFGTALAIEPYLTAVILCGGLLARGGSEALKADLLPRVAAGEIILALAQIERQSRFDLEDVGLTARADAGHYVLEGEKSVVIGGGAADYFIVSARTAGQRRDADGITLFLVDAKAPGVSRRAYPTQDGMAAAEVSFGQVRVPADHILGEIGQGLPLLSRSVDEAIAALCAEAVGGMQALTDMTVDYLKTRKQFGVAIASFQALQHRAVDMRIQLEQARSMAIYAALTVATEDAEERRKAVSAAKVQVGRAARLIGQTATQLHGGIGVTMEYKGGHYFKRLTMIDQAFGDSEHHLRLVAAAGGLDGGV